MPGGSRYHQAPLVIAPLWYAWLSMAPQDTSVGSPRPRNTSVVSDKIALATVRLVDTRISGVTFGSTCLTSTCRLLAPSAGARSMNGRASTARTCERSVSTERLG